MQDAALTERTVMDWKLTETDSDNSRQDFVNCIVSTRYFNVLCSVHSFKAQATAWLKAVAHPEGAKGPCRPKKRKRKALRVAVVVTQCFGVAND